MVVLKWTNKYSGDTGYVASISTKGQRFISTFNIDEARRYSEKAVKGIMTKLENYHETDNNIFEAIEA